jgi:hypothetical protein
MGGGGHDHTLEPPLYRLPLPNRALPEEDELIWNDRVAPETALDLDAPHISPLEGLVFWLGGFAFFYSVYLYAASTDHPANKPTVRALTPRCARPPRGAPAPRPPSLARRGPAPGALPPPQPQPQPLESGLTGEGRAARPEGSRGARLLWQWGWLPRLPGPLFSRRTRAPRRLSLALPRATLPRTPFSLVFTQNASRELDEESLAVSLGGYTKGGYAQ